MWHWSDLIGIPHNHHVEHALAVTSGQSTEYDQSTADRDYAALDPFARKPKQK